MEIPLYCQNCICVIAANSKPHRSEVKRREGKGNEETIYFNSNKTNNEMNKKLMKIFGYCRMTNCPIKLSHCKIDSSIFDARVLSNKNGSF